MLAVAASAPVGVAPAQAVESGSAGRLESFAAPGVHRESAVPGVSSVPSSEDRLPVGVMTSIVDGSSAALKAANDFLAAWAEAKEAKKGGEQVLGKAVTAESARRLLAMAEKAIEAQCSPFEAAAALATIDLSLHGYVRSLMDIRDDRSQPAAARMKAAELILLAPSKMLMRHRLLMKGPTPVSSAAPPPVSNPIPTDMITRAIGAMQSETAVPPAPIPEGPRNVSQADEA